MASDILAFKQLPLVMLMTRLLVWILYSENQRSRSRIG